MFHTIFYIPLYNALIFFAYLFSGNIGLAVIGLTLLVKIILSPLSYRSITSQIEQKKLQPLIADIRKQYPDKKEQSQKLMDLYKEHKTSPFAGCLLILLQLPVIIALYQVFLNGTTINPAEIYSWVSTPGTVHSLFLGMDLQAKSLILALLAGVTQFLQMYWSPAMQSDKSGTVVDEKNMDTQERFAASMQSTRKYTMPVMITVFAYFVPGAVALYWVVSNIFMIAQEWWVMRRMKAKEGVI